MSCAHTIRRYRPLLIPMQGPDAGDGRRENRVHAHWVVEAEGSGLLGIGPVWSRPSLVIPAETEKRPPKAASIEDPFFHSQSPMRNARLLP